MARLDELSPKMLLAVQTEIGRMLVASPLVAVLAGHEGPLDPLADYLVCGPDDDDVTFIAKMFLRQIVQRDARAFRLVADWYTPGAVERHANAIGEALMRRPETEEASAPKL